MAHCCSINSSPVELSKFVKVLSKEPNWYMLGVHLSVPLNKLEMIERTHAKDFSRCLVELHKLFGKNSLNWEVIADALEIMHNYNLADKVRTEYCVPSTAPLETMSTETTPPSGYGVSSTDEVMVQSGPVVPQEFESLNEGEIPSSISGNGVAHTKSTNKKGKHSSLTVKLINEAENDGSDDDRASTVEVSYPEGLSTHLLEGYFQGPKSGGGSDKAVDWVKDIEPGKCHIKFESDRGII